MNQRLRARRHGVQTAGWAIMLAIGALASCRSQPHGSIDDAAHDAGHVSETREADSSAPNDAGARSDAAGAAADLEQRRAAYRLLAATATPVPVGSVLRIWTCPEHYGFVDKGHYCGKLCSFYADGLCTLPDGGDDTTCCGDHRCNTRTNIQVPWGRPDGPMPLVCSRDGGAGGR